MDSWSLLARVFSLAAYLVLVCILPLPTVAQFFQQGNKLVGAGAVGSAGQGYSVGLSGDGNTAIVGAPYDNGSTGAAWIYTRTNGVWNQQAASWSVQGLKADPNKVTPLQFRPMETQQFSVAQRGRPEGLGYSLAAPVSGRNRGEELVGSVSCFDMSGSQQGYSVALSADGSTALIGGPLDCAHSGAAWVFTRSNGVWTQQGSKLHGTGAVSSRSQGWAVALSGDGNTCVVGEPDDNGYAGAVWVFTRGNGSWTQQGSKLVANDVTELAYFGQSVALSGDGNTLLVGTRLGDVARIFTRTNGVLGPAGHKACERGRERKCPTRLFGGALV